MLEYIILLYYKIFKNFNENYRNKNFKTLFKCPKQIKRYGEVFHINNLKQKEENKPLISIITVVKNNEKYLEQTIKSVLSQEYKNFEYIIIDGGSTDNTISIIKKFSNEIDYWLSENDHGIYDAFNKGMQLAKGDFIGMVNSDDTLERNALSILVKYIQKNPNIDFVFGSVKKHWGIHMDINLIKLI